jgi:hypothetical protein
MIRPHLAGVADPFSKKKKKNSAANVRERELLKSFLE